MMQTRPYHDYEEYYSDIYHNLHKLNRAGSLDEQAVYLSNLRECDEYFIQLLNINPDKKMKSIFFTRHGQCSVSHKNFGLAPNTPVEESALAAIEKANGIIKNMFSPLSRSCVVISPMVRAKQTASKIIPDQWAASIETRNFLTENSSHPSGKPLLSMTDLEKERGLLFSMSNYLYDDHYFEDLSLRLHEANNILKNKSPGCFNENDSHTDYNLSDKHKIDLINRYIQEINHDEVSDIWFIGHGKNTQNYFEMRYQISDAMEFCETRKVIRYHDIYDNALEFVPPYVVRINQESGLFTGCILNDKKLYIIDGDPIQYLDRYLKDTSNYQAINESPLFFKAGSDVNYNMTKAVKHLIEILREEDNSPLSEAEVNLLKNSVIEVGLKKYNIDIDAVNGFLENKIQKRFL